MARRRNEPADDEEDDLAGRAMVGLLTGDLEPLADYLRSDFDLHPIIARMIADAIDGGAEYKLELHKRGKRGGGNVVRRLLSSFRENEVGMYVEAILPKYDNDTEAAVHDAMEEFRLSRATVFGHLRAWRARSAKLGQSSDKSK